MLGFRAISRAARTTPWTSYRQASTVGASLEEAVDRLPHKEALRSIKQDIRWSYQELDKYVQEMANGFHGQQFTHGSVLAVWLPNSAENLVTQLAAARAGVTLALVDPQISTAKELESILHDSKANGLLFAPKMNDTNATSLVQELLPELKTSEEKKTLFRPRQFRHLHSVISTATDHIDGVIPFYQMMVNSPEPVALKNMLKAVTPDSPLAISYSRVEGGEPKKSQVYTHAKVLEESEKLSKKLQLVADDKVCMVSKDAGFSLAPLAAINQSCLTVLPSFEHDEDAIKYAMRLENCSIVGSGSSDYKRI